MTGAAAGQKGPVSSQRILVTGASGFIGGLLARRLLADGFAVRCLPPGDVQVVLNGDGHVRLLPR